VAAKHRFLAQEALSQDPVPCYHAQPLYLPGSRPQRVDSPTPAPEEPAAEHLSEEEYNRVVNDGADSAVITSLFGLETPYSAEADKRRERVSQLEAKKIQEIALLPEEEEELAQLQHQIPHTASAAVEAALRRLEDAR
jgi:hypothetical protein